NMNSSRRKRLVTAKQSESCGLNILRRNVVRNVDDVCRGIDRKNHSLHCGDKIVLCAEVSKKSDDGIRKGETIFHLSFDICHLPLISDRRPLCRRSSKPS